MFLDGSGLDGIRCDQFNISTETSDDIGEWALILLPTMVNIIINIVSYVCVAAHGYLYMSTDVRGDQRHAAYLPWARDLSGYELPIFPAPCCNVLKCTYILWFLTRLLLVKICFII